MFAKPKPLLSASSNSDATWTLPSTATWRCVVVLGACLLAWIPSTGCSPCPVKPRVAIKPTLPPGEPADPTAQVRAIGSRVTRTAAGVLLTEQDWRDLLLLVRELYEWGEALEVGADWQRSDGHGEEHGAGE